MSLGITSHIFERKIPGYVSVNVKNNTHVGHILKLHTKRVFYTKNLAHASNFTQMTPTVMYRFDVATYLFVV